MEHARIRESNVTKPEDSGVPRTVDSASSTRHAPPASEGLLAGSTKLVHADVRRSRNYPAKSGPMSLQTTEELIATAIAEMDEFSPPEIAQHVGVSTQARTVREVIAAARERFAARADAYVELHMLAAYNAALKGDSGPAEWAIEHIVEDGKRVVDVVSKSETKQPTLQIGIALGGIPQPAQVVSKITDTPALPPTVDADVLP